MEEIEIMEEIIEKWKKAFKEKYNREPNEDEVFDFEDELENLF